MRGKQPFSLIDIQPNGITPAHAGKTFLPSVHPYRQGDHPRACGENRYGVTRLLENIGSPPRMRGKRASVGSAGLEGGITPAHAGKTNAE